MDKNVTEKLKFFFTKFKHQAYKKGEILIRAAEEPPGIFYLKSGIVKEYAISRKGDELVVNIFRPVSFFPMSWAINDTHNSYYFEAMTNIDIWKAPRNKVIAFIKKEPDVLYDLLGRVFKGTDGLLTRMTYLMAGSAYARLVTELIIQTKRFGVELKLSETDLAAQTGMTRETVSREMKMLKDKGIVMFSKNILIISNLENLEAELAPF